MKNFEKIGQGIEVMPLLAALDRHPEFWNQNNLRQLMPTSAHTQVDDIWIRFNQINEGLEFLAFNDLESINYPAFFALPEAAFLLTTLMAAVGGQRLGRVIISRIEPGKGIAPHKDEGDNPKYYDRFHICLQAGEGCLFRAGDETVNMMPGECWRFDNKVEHQVRNGSDISRLHLIADIRLPK